MMDYFVAEIKKKQYKGHRNGKKFNNKSPFSLAVSVSFPDALKGLEIAATNLISPYV